jgi:hypothetical protein
MMQSYSTVPRNQTASFCKTALVDLGLYGLTHEHSARWVPAITTILKERWWTHA